MNDKARELVSDEQIHNLLETLHVRYWDAPELVKKWLSPILDAAEAKGREEERERCAKICDDVYPHSIVEIKRRILEPKTTEAE